MKFAVVGRSNKGKSSIVATLVENDEILIAPTPRTTLISQEFALKIGDRKLITVIDTPGFEEAPAALEWLKQEPVAAHQRRQRVQAFYDAFQGSPRFQFECELLKPLLFDEAYILYVVDASHPYRPNFEAEFEILQWTGQPSLALLNQTGDGQWVADWQAALHQYFRKTVIFNAHTARFEERIRILEELRFLSDDARPVLDEAMALLKNQHESRLRAASYILAEFIAEATYYRKKIPVDEEGLTEREKEKYLKDFYNHIRQREKASRLAIAQVFNFKSLESEEAELNTEGDPDDLFGRETWEFLGLSRTELIATGTAAGALAGGTLDASVGGASFMAGAGVGAVLGGLGIGYFAFSDAQVAGLKLSRKTLTVGPLRNPNFPWIILDRGLLFMTSILSRTHAQRGRLLVDEKHAGPSSRLSKTEKRNIAWNLGKLRWIGRSEATSSGLATEIRKGMEKL
ncbi:MAG TPA: GTPase/DUF3482 domain-containing protein [Oligoflexus sp.]|uniref:GTPase/DUF3482 domain-containing protein n=1 Tax=Oligoflexus sp. TaxID=1971216 RepID=UPI002D700DFC|nr:GTPase/DUF3482 domain-containing protein [Oligoflexus sp.]HYX31819.1 GTPase/DUF3482 domain-containing protein [Oligoflexus sp.]